MTTLRQAAIAVVERWDAPMWRDMPSTARYMEDLRKALEAPLLHTFLDEAKKAGITHLVQPKEAMQMALDALQSCAENTENPMETRDALNALREALEAPEQEPVGVIRHLDELNAEWTQHLLIGTKLYAKPVEAPNIKELQAEGKGPAPCARFCEANAFQNAIRQAEQGSQVLQAKCDAFFANTLLALKEIDDLTKESDEYRTAADSMATAHKTERDEYQKAAVRTAVNCKFDYDALMADAIRYRWLTKQIADDNMEQLEKAFSAIDPLAESITKDEFDAAIDAGMKEAP